MRNWNNLNLAKTPLFIAALLIGVFLLNSCSVCDCEEEPSFIDMRSTFILKSGVFIEPEDLDGPGPMEPTENAKVVWEDLISFHHSCMPSEDIVYNMNYVGIDGIDRVELVCPDSEGSTTPFTLGVFLSETGVGKFSFSFYGINDPLDLFQWPNGIIFDVEELYVDIDKGKKYIIGTAILYSNYKDPSDMPFTFVFEEFPI